MDQIIPVVGINIMPNPRQRVDIGLAHGDDLFLEPDLEAGEGLVLSGAFLVLKPGAARKGAQIVKNGVDPGARACDGAVDALMRQQKRAGNAVCAALLQQRPLQSGGVLESGKVIKCCDCIHNVAN